MKKFLRLYSRMTNCCFIFSLQAGVVIIGVLGIVWTVTSMVMNLVRPYESTLKGVSMLQYTVAYLVLILICGGHICILLAGSWEHPNLILIGFAYNTGILFLWLVLSMLSYVNSPGLIAGICIEGRCPDVLWLFDTYWRDTGVKCTSGTGDSNLFLATRDIFSIAPMLGFVGHWPDYIEQPGLGVPCYDNIPDTAHYINYFESGNSSCPRADWLSFRTAIRELRRSIYHYYMTQHALPVTTAKIPIYPYPRRFKRSNNIEDYDDYNSALNETILNKTALFNQYLQQGCQLNQPRYIVVSLAISMFFACFFLYGRAVEFNYYHELIMPFTLERARFKPPKDQLVIMV